MQKKQSVIFCCLLIYSLILIGGVGAETNTYETALANYKQAGLVEYFEMRTALWTETAKRRLDLEKQLPEVERAAAVRCQKALLMFLERQPKHWQALVMAGAYHLYQHQNDTARWYFEQAFQVAPDSSSVRLALADFYLEEWQPEKALNILEGMSGAEVSFRQGEAYWQAGKYRLALGALLVAEPLPIYLRNVREKDLLKALLTVGEIKYAKRLHLDQNKSEILSILWQELQGWQKQFSGSDDEALKLWKQGAKSFPDYELFGNECYWLEPPMKENLLVSLEKSTDPYIKSQAHLLRGQAYLANGNLEIAAKEFNLAIKNDRHALIGLLEAGQVSFNQQNYLTALKFFNQGLEINPNCGPLLEKRALTLAKLARDEEASRDQAAAENAEYLVQKTSKIQGLISLNEQRQMFLELYGETKRMIGLWISKDHQEWQYYPWWGGPLLLKQEASQLWILPVGTGLSGEVLFLKNKNLPLLTPKDLQIQTLETKCFLKLPFKAEVVIAKEIQGRLEGVYSNNQAEIEHLLPSNFNNNTNKLLIWLETEEHQRGMVELEVETTKGSTPKIVCQLSSLVSQTNQHEITLRLKPLQNGDPPLKMMISEAQNSNESSWQPYRSEFQYLLSPGDGPKVITAQYLDHDGNLGIAVLKIILDTKPPKLMKQKSLFLNPELVKIEWATDEIVSSHLRLLTNSGEWVNIPTAPNRDFSQITLFNKNIVYYQLLLMDASGNQAYYSISNLNETIKERKALSFIINEGQTKTKSRTITIKPLEELNKFRWSVSNDLKVWAPEQFGSSKLRWRIGATKGENLIYIKYTLADAPTQLQVFSLVYDNVN